ncbi:ABC transporter ATP-binding protein [Gloeobacter kilaueensis]|uniref:ABC transporter, ATP-binding protein n=1 Tax=Gloeobacter kilaueensis (strain ATCC BAA-2537 / CCAP 1431/1 / ULC 316 / JS1) TaxID=1183438 RepID=U5QLY6_GLOK1|nr:ABC transporter ATP-binding protein [Gloeobacter kilaueensis]AGY59997.1 ABC transporter, ATP-binding protein [Gloeobacter kilaueensis JS1]
MDSLIRVADLGFRPPGQSDWVIQGVQLQLAAGEIVLVAGPTGSGKSTLLGAIAGIVPAHTGGTLTGEIQLDGQSLGSLSVRERSRSIGTVLQNVEVQIFTDRVWEELAFGLENLNVPPDLIAVQIEGALKDFALTSQSDWPVARLSAGQKQRLVLASVLAMNQPVLLLDEPFAYLDRSGSAFLLELLAERARAGQAILLVEHRLELVRSLAQRSYHFAGGALLAGLPPPETAAAAAVPTGSVGPVVLESARLSYGGYPPLPDLQVRAGERVLLQGGNGCGKTTLLKLLSGLLTPASGTLTILGVDALRQPVTRRARQVGFVLQNPNHQLFADTAQGELAQPGVGAALVEQLLEQLDLTAEGSRHPQSLSQGQKRRLALGAVLARQPRILLLDEITVGQDPRSLALMLAALERFSAGGGALILTSHDPAAARLASQVVAL